MGGASAVDLIGAPSAPSARNASCTAPRRLPCRFARSASRCSGGGTTIPRSARAQARTAAWLRSPPPAPSGRITSRQRAATRLVPSRPARRHAPATQGTQPLAPRAEPARDRLAPRDALQGLAHMATADPSAQRVATTARYPNGRMASRGVASRRAVDRGRLRLRAQVRARAGGVAVPRFACAAGQGGAGRGARVASQAGG